MIITIITRQLLEHATFAVIICKFLDQFGFDLIVWFFRVDYLVSGNTTAFRYIWCVFNSSLLILLIYQLEYITFCQGEANVSTARKEL